jgi:ribosome modulation factor
MHKKKSVIVFMFALATPTSLLFGKSTQLDKDSASECPAQMSQENCWYYKNGFSDGQADRSVGMHNLQARPEKGFERPIEPAYRSGYQNGYKSLKQTNILK